MIFSAIVSKHYYRYLVEGTTIEIVWTIIPAVILVFIAFPSLQLLYSIDEVVDPSLTVKVIGINGIGLMSTQMWREKQ